MLFLRRTLALIALLSLLGCAGQKHPAAELAAGGSGGYEAELRQLETLPAPSGVNTQVWQELKAALAALLAGGSRQSSTPPTSDGSETTLSLDPGSLTLGWLYFNQSDYDQNGEVNIGDLTPIAIHFGESAGGGSFGGETVQSIVDGDGNGEINIADVSPIGVNFGRAALSYNVYRSLSASDVPLANDGPNGPGAELLGNVPLDSAGGNSAQQRLTFSFTLASANLAWFYWVRPNDSADGSGADGTPSSLVSFGGAGGNQAPVAALSADPLLDAVPSVVSFDASASLDPDGANGDISDILQFEWDFEGDGIFDTSIASPLIEHLYFNPGAFNATVRVLDSGAASDTASVLISLSGGGNNQPPDVSLSADPPAGEAPFDVTLTATAADDGGPNQLTFEWDFDGDGVIDDNTGSTPQIVHNYNTVGEFNTVVKVTDSSDLSVTDSILITSTAAGNLAPIASFTPADTSGSAPLSISFDPSASTDSDGTIVLYRWDFNGDGSFDLETPTPSVQVINFGAQGLYKPILQVVDDQAGKDQAQIVIQVTGGWLINEIRRLRADNPIKDVAVAPFNKSDASQSRVHIAFTLNDRSLRHNRSSNNVGTVWDSGEEVVVNFNASRIPNAALHLGVVQQKPAIAYIDDSGGKLRYVRCNDEFGTSWPNPVTVAGESDGSGPALAIVEGTPAVSWVENGGANSNARYSRADISTGMGNWSSFVQALSSASGTQEFKRTHLQVTSDGDPAIVTNLGPLLAVRAKDKFGEEWEDGATLSAPETPWALAPCLKAAIQASPFPVRY